MSFFFGGKKADTELLPYQKRVSDKLQTQPGLVAYFGTGKGKSLAALGAVKNLNKPATAVVPAALRENLQKEEKKHFQEKLPVHIESLENVARKQTGKTNPFLIVDEAHLLRDPSSKSLSAIKNLSNDAEKTLLLTGTPMVNSPSDIAPLVNLAAKEKLLPENKEEFEKKYVYRKQVNPSLLQRLKGIKPGEKLVVNKHEADNLRGIFNKWVDYEKGTTEGFPSVEEQEIEVPMSKNQLALYDTVMNQAPPWVAAKVKSNLPPNKQESKQLNSYLVAARQLLNTTGGYINKGDPESPKIQRAYEELQKVLQNDPEAKGVIYSNFLGSGLDPYKQLLEKDKIPYGEFTGRIPQELRDQHIRDYNEGKLKALLISGAGQRGLDLKGTSLMQLLEPAWNEPSLDQAKARAIRYKSHEHLPEEKRKVLVQKFLATRPKSISQRIGLADKEYAVDEYLKNLSKNKAELINQFEDLMKPQETQKVAGSWRQALDNKSKDVMFNNGVEVRNDLERQNMVRDLYSIGKKLSIKDSIQKPESPSFKQVGHKYILTIPLKEKDAAGRQSSIVNWGEGPPNKQNIINEIRSATKGVSPITPIEDIMNNIQYSRTKHLTSKYRYPLLGGALLGVSLLGYGGKKLYNKYTEKTAKIQDEVDKFHNTKDYKLVMKNISSPKFRKLLIQASDDPRFHNFLNNLGKHSSGRQKEETQVKSSTKDIMYSVKKHKDDSYTCSCPDYLFKKSPDNKECKHIVSVKGHTKTAIIGTALLAGGLHFGTNAAMKALKNSHMGHSLESAQFATGMRNALQGKKLHPVAKDVMQYGIGPESMVSMDAGSLLGKHLSTLPKAKQFKSLKKIRKAVGMTEAVKNAPIVKDVIPGINRHLSGNTSLLDKIPTVPIDQSTTKLQKAISLGLGAGAVAADPHSIVHMGINALRKGIGESSKGKEFMKNQFMSGIKNKPLNPALSAITDIAISPAALDTRRIGEAAHKELQNPRLKNILSMLSGS